MILKKVFLSVLLITSFCLGQKNLGEINADLAENANSVVRNKEVIVEIKSISKILITTKSLITVFNKNGLNNVDAFEYYDKSTSINSIEATVYNKWGAVLKKIKKSDFIDQSVADGFSVFSDNRILYLNYEPTEYPITIEYQSEIIESNTAFLPSFMPINDFYESLENTSFYISAPKELGLKYFEQNIENFNGLTSEKTDTFIKYNVKNSKAIKQEELSPSLQNIFPNVSFALNKFSLEGKEGTNESWIAFGNWMNKDLLSNRNELSEETKTYIQKLVANETDVLKKAKIIYQFMQSKTRYVSVQLGIGGWRPMKASEVDKFGYGDCKGLTNYTKALLEVAGIPSYYTVIFGGTKPRNINNEFVSMQGNHVILTLPYQDKYIFLECTSQDAPFGYLGNFTDNRNALIVKEKSEIVRTTSYAISDNVEDTKSEININENGSTLISFTKKSFGVEYGNNCDVSKKSKDDIIKYYKNKFSWLNDLILIKHNFIDDKDKAVFEEKVELSTSNYCEKNGQSYFFIINAIDRQSYLPTRYRNRSLPFELSRGYTEISKSNITIPINFKIDNLPNNIKISSKYGEYSASFTQKNNIIIYERIFKLNNGNYTKSEYEEFRAFLEKIVNADNSKGVITKIN
ncbi:DUF3857 domain-containing protein [Flavobacterium croceum]|uniref:DUF3857 domain-containing protein n=1 Tax=Flavobacterium croceum TaxID=370975 RepID=UPI0024A7E36D|nr:DUF3857 domain-containing protein [Flavobacterium croceum]